MKVLRYILLLLIIGLCSLPFISNQASASILPDATHAISSVLNDLTNDYTKRLQQQYDWTDAIMSSQISNCNQENRVRSRRHERISTSWQLRTHVHQLYALLKQQEISNSHSINQIVALSHIMPLNLPTEQISFPFHSFW